MAASRLLIVYASHYGQTEKVAHYLASAAIADGKEVDVVHVDRLPADAPLDGYETVIVAGSVQWGRHQRSLRKFVERNLAGLSSRRTAFLSVSGAAGSEEGRPLAEQYVHRFLHRTGWHPDTFELVAGGVAFTRYGLFTRLVQKRATKSDSRIVDTHRDYDFTDWDALDRFAREFIGNPDSDQKTA
jgi:menaquinone-dependent protoporphyrinogen oxidase